jgi:hypothetical protein
MAAVGIWVLLWVVVALFEIKEMLDRILRRLLQDDPRS